MTYTFFTDQWSKPFMEKFANDLRPHYSKGVNFFNSVSQDKVPIAENLSVRNYPLDIKEVAKYDLAIWHRDSERIFNDMYPVHHAMNPEVRLISFLMDMYRRLLDHFRENETRCLFVFQPIRADRIMAVTIARSMGIPVVSINPEPFPGFYALDNGAPQHTGIMGSTDMWHRIKRAKFTDHEEVFYQTWKKYYIEGRHTRDRGDDPPDEVEVNIDPDKPGVLIIGQCATDANQFVYKLGIDYRPDLIAEYIAIHNPGILVYYKPHPRELKKDLDKLDWNSGFDNIIHLPGKSNVHEIFRHPHINHVITWNSNAGIEALIYGKKVCVLGESFYRGKGFTYDLCETDQVISKSLGGFVNIKPLWQPDQSLIEQYLKFLVCRYLVPVKDVNAVCNRIDKIAFDYEFYGV